LFLDDECIPAAAIRINSHQIVCPRHEEQQNKPRTYLCQMCVNRKFFSLFFNSQIMKSVYFSALSKKDLAEGLVWVCKVCPCMFHVSCLDADDAEMTRDGFACLYCCDGFFPKYDDRIWAKLGSSRWWPAKIIPPKAIPDNLLAAPHTDGQFVVQFYGTKDYTWISNKSTFLMQSKVESQINFKV